MPTPKLTPEIIHAAIEGFESQKRRIDGQISELRSMLLGGSAENAATLEAPTRKRKKFSADARKRMMEAQQRRWAKVRRGDPSEPPAPEPTKPKRKLTAAAKAKLVANLMKARAAKTAKAKAAAKNTAPARKKAAAKKAAVKTAPKASKRAPVKKAAARKKTVPPPAPTVPEAVAQ